MPATMFDITGQVPIVTGGNGGSGRGIARGLANAGATIVVADRNEEKTAAVISDLQSLGIKALGVVTDVSEEKSVAAMIRRTVEEFGRIDILVNNAGIGIRKAPQDYTLDEWNQVMDINLTGAFLCSRDVHPHMLTSSKRLIQYLRFREGFSFGAVESTSYDSTDIRNQRPMRGDRMASLSWRRSVPNMLPNGGYMQNTFLLVPYWMIFSAVSLTLAVAIVRAWRRARRVQTGYCSKCGYNRTGLPESRCPKCGTRFER